MEPFVPQFRDDVSQVNEFTGGRLPENPQRCLSDDSAVQLEVILQPITAVFYPAGRIGIFPAPPTPVAPGPNVFTANVPWLRISGQYRGVPNVVVEVNAGDIAHYWVVGPGTDPTVGQQTALALAIADLTGRIEAARALADARNAAAA